MKKLILISLIVTNVFICHSQAIYFPDISFKNRLLAIDPKIDTNGNGEIDETEASLVTSLDVYDKSITDLTGIEYFTNLTSLNCDHNKIKYLDLSYNTALTYLDCSFNRILNLDLSYNKALTKLICGKNDYTSLDLSANVQLVELDCNYNSLTQLDISSNIALTKLICGSSSITNLDLSKNIELTGVYCQKSKLTGLDVRNNVLLKSLYCYENSNLKTICINTDQLEISKFFNTDAATTISTSCEIATALEIEAKELNPNRKLVKVINSQGQDINLEETRQGLYIYTYSDGTSRKVFVK